MEGTRKRLFEFGPPACDQVKFDGGMYFELE